MGKRVSLLLAALMTVTALACGLTGGATDEELGATTGSQPEVDPGTTTAEAASTATSPEEEEETQIVVRPADGMVMVRIPAGEFVMGDDEAAAPTERPQHLVSLDAYWIDRLEVTNAQYRLCVKAGSCEEPRSWTDVNFNGDDQPAVVPWDSADAYCTWAGARLPTEAEWEKAARGTDGRKWPWGNTFEANRANISGEEDGYGFTAPVGSFPEDTSPYGVLDVAGNATEWVADWWDAEYYSHSPERNPAGPPAGDQKVHRAPIAHAGGGPAKCRCTVRYPARPDEFHGFRCAATTAVATPEPEPD